ncbi:MAG: hypothetical protein SOW18_00700 [Peptoniphilus sp.]|nr:hypothetical protein [Peptoniphilus sp.]MDY3118039.1 hypothetical protein [Peptoniphilus sp.]
MKKFFVFLLLLLTACGPIKGDNYRMIEKPTINRSPLQGRWVVTKVQAVTDENEDLRSFIGSDAIFSPDGAIFNNQRVDNPTYVVLKGKTDYLMKLGYNKTKDDVGIVGDHLFVIDIYQDDQWLFTVYREKDDVAYIDIYGNLLQLVKTKGTLDERQLKNMMDRAETKRTYYSKVPGK